LRRSSSRTSSKSRSAPRFCRTRSVFSRAFGEREPHPGGRVARASGPVDPEQQAIFFYLYCDDVDAKHADLSHLGLNPTEIRKPFYAPRGEFRIADPDGYGLMITHTRS
jgi:hypothetical protein